MDSLNWDQSYWEREYVQIKLNLRQKQKNQGLTQEEVSTFAILTEFNKCEQEEVKKFQYINQQLQGVEENLEEHEEFLNVEHHTEEVPSDIFKSDQEILQSQFNLQQYQENQEVSEQNESNSQQLNSKQQLIQQQVVIQKKPPQQKTQQKEKVKSQLEEDIEELEKELRFQENQILQLDLENDQQKQRTMYGESQIEITKAELAELQEQLPKLKRDAEKHNFLNELMQDRDPLSKLKQEIQSNEEKLAYMNLEWDEYKKPIENEIVEKKKVLNKKQNVEVDLDEEIKQMKKEGDVIVIETQTKTEQSKFLQLQVEQIASQINKKIYVKKLQDIMKALKTQKSEMLKVVVDITDAQAEIAKLQQEAALKAKSGEEVAFLKAKESQNETYKEIYKSLIDLRDLYQALIDEIQKQGEKKNNIRDLELKIDATIARNTNNNINKLKQDLQNLQKEQSELLSSRSGKKQR